MLSYRILASLPLFVVIACGSPTYEDAEHPTDSVEDQGDIDNPSATTNTGTGGGGQTTSDPDPDPEPSFAPLEGTWTVQEGGLVEDNCGLGDYTDRGEPGSTMELFVGGTASFELTFLGGGEQLDCEWDDSQAFDCGVSYVEDHTPADYGLDAVIDVAMWSDGNFPAEGEMSLSTELELECSGPDCEWVELFMGTVFPCTMLSNAESLAD